MSVSSNLVDMTVGKEFILRVFGKTLTIEDDCILVVGREPVIPVMPCNPVIA